MPAWPKVLFDFTGEKKGEILQQVLQMIFNHSKYSDSITIIVGFGIIKLKPIPVLLTTKNPPLFNESKWELCALIVNDHG